MALTIDYDNYTFRDRLNDCLVRRFQMTGPTSYPTGGVVIDNLGDFGWGETHSLLGTLWNVAIAAALGLALPPAALLGIATGLMASGLYSTAKTLITPNR